MKVELGVSFGALGLSALSLGLSAWTWSRSGPRVSVTVDQMALHATGTREDVTMVTASNRGRSAVEVTNWWFLQPDGQGMVLTRPHPASKPLPYRLEAGSEASWFIGTDLLLAELKQAGQDHRQVRAQVSLGNGKRASASRKGIGIRPGKTTPANRQPAVGGVSGEAMPSRKR